MDSSALLAIILDEPEESLFSDLIYRSSAKMSVASYFEVALKVDSLVDELHPVLDATIDNLGITLVPVSAEQGSIARTANVTFGKKRHAARLNFGDCLTYALAKISGEPLLYKGDDFSKTDLVAAVDSRFIP